MTASEDELTEVALARGQVVTVTLGDGSDLTLEVSSETAPSLAASGAPTGPQGRRKEPRRRPSARVGAAGRSFAPLTHPVSVSANGVSVSVPTRQLRPGSGRPPARRLLLDSVTFAVEPGQIVAVVGPSGVGKSTLVKAMTGAVQITGSVRYNRTEVTPENSDEIRRQIGYVPQDDVLHADLTLREAFTFAADLRLPDLDDAARREAVAALVDELLLTQQLDSRIRDLSGGERKRASVGIELLTRPAVLFLDEPTTGLDPDAERLLLRILRRLAHDGRHTILMITHAAAVLPSCDRILVIGRGARRAGTVAFYGTPRETLSFFGGSSNDFAWVYEQLRNEAEDWPRRFRYSQFAKDNVQAALARAAAWGDFSQRPAWPKPLRQVWTLAHRNFVVARGNERYFLALAWQAPIMVVLLTLVLGWHNLSGQLGANPRGLLSFTTVAALAIGLINSCREIVKELAIYQRERTVGMSAEAYLAAKLVFLIGLSAVQSLLLAAVMFNQDGLSSGLLLPRRMADVALVLFLAVVCAAAAGLAISAVVSSDSTALVMAPIILVSQLLLTGAFMEVEDKVLLTPMAYATPAYWTFSALAASNDLNDMERLCPASAPVGAAPGAQAGSTSPPAPPPTCGDLWEHARGTFLADIAALVTLTILYTAGALAALRRHDLFGRKA